MIYHSNNHPYKARENGTGLDDVYNMVEEGLNGLEQEGVQEFRGWVNGVRHDAVDPMIGQYPPEGPEVWMSLSL